MKVNQKKANQIKGLFATINKLELDDAISRQDEETYASPEFVSFNCDIEYSDVYNEFSCELSSQKMIRHMNWVSGKYMYISDLAFGGHWPTTQTLWDDRCSYFEFKYIVMFAREAIKSGGTKFMKYASHKVTVDMPDYLNFELNQGDSK